MGPAVPEENWSVDDYVARIERGRASFAAVQAAVEAEESARLHALMPASAALRKILQDVERRAREVRGQRRHEVTAHLRQPSPGCIRVTLRWGPKFGLTEADRHLIHSYQRAPRRRFLRYPDVVVAHEYHEIAGVLDADDEGLHLDPGTRVDIEELLTRPAVVRSAVEAALARPRTHRLHLHRADRYRTPVVPA